MINDKHLHLFEEHSSTLPIWWQYQQQHAGDAERASTVVYLDAHLDLQKVSQQAIVRLAACQSLQQVQALESPSHFNPNEKFSYGIENFLYAAHKLNLLERLIWVAPEHIPRRYSSSLLDYMQQIDGITFEQLSGFKEVAGGALRGTLMGLDITICDYQSLQQLQLAENYLLDIDIDYFVEVPADRLWVDPAAVIEEIVEQLGKPQVATISRAVTSGFTPLAFRFVGDYLYSQLSSNKEDFEYYQTLYTAVVAMAEQRLPAGQTLCEQLIEQRPALGAAYYLLALCSSDAAQKQDLLAKAESVDPQYGFNLAREAIGLVHRKKQYDPNTVRRLANAVTQLALGSSERGEANVALAQVLANAGLVKPAKQLLHMLHGDFTAHPDVALAIASKLLQEPAQREECLALLEVARVTAKNGSAAMLYLADIAWADDNIQEAARLYSAVHQRAPAWMLPLQRLGQCYARLGEVDAEQDNAALLEHRETIISGLLNHH